jgi:hypothetical protein
MFGQPQAPVCKTAAVLPSSIAMTDYHTGGEYGTIWFDELGDTEGVVHQRNVTVFAYGEVDRSPCGSGTCARLAVLAADGRIAADRGKQQVFAIGPHDPLVPGFVLR